eukprot:10315-Heterococcus_DN1.PRE.2
MEVYRLISTGTIEELSYMNSLYKLHFAHAMNSAKSVRASHFAALYNADEVGNELFSKEHMMCYSTDSLLTTAMQSTGTNGRSASASSVSSIGGSKRSRVASSSSSISSSTAVIAEVKQDDVVNMLSCAITSVAVSITAATAAAAEAAISSINDISIRYAAGSYAEVAECVSFTDMMLQQLGVANMLYREPLTSSGSSSRRTSGSSDSRSIGSGSSRSTDVHKRSAVRISDSDSSSAKLSYTKARSTKRCTSTASNERHKRPQQLPCAYNSRKYDYNQHRSAQNDGSSDCRGSDSSSSNARHSLKRRAVHNRDSDSSGDEFWTW